MQHVETHEGEGEIQRERGGTIAVCSYRVEVYAPEIASNHLRGGGISRMGMRETVLADLRWPAEISLPIGNLLLVTRDGQRLRFTFTGSSYEALGGLE
jgi:hypothetical protein